MPPKNYADIFASMSPEELQRMLDGTLAGPRGVLAGQDYAQAQQQYETPQPGGRNLGYTYVASNPMEHLAAAIKGVQGQRGMQDARVQQNKQIDSTGLGLAQAVELIRRAQQPVSQPDPFADVRQEGY
jgi:hypothetical protein